VEGGRRRARWVGCRAAGVLRPGTGGSPGCPRTARRRTRTLSNTYVHIYIYIYTQRVIYVNKKYRRRWGRRKGAGGNVTQLRVGVPTPANSLPRGKSAARPGGAVSPPRPGERGRERSARCTRRWRTLRAASTRAGRPRKSDRHCAEKGELTFSVWNEKQLVRNGTWLTVYKEKKKITVSHTQGVLLSFCPAVLDPL